MLRSEMNFIKLKPDKDEIERAKSALLNGFLWEHTPQGANYWDEVVRNLESIIKAIEENEKCAGKTIK